MYKFYYLILSLVILGCSPVVHKRHIEVNNQITEGILVGKVGFTNGVWLELKPIDSTSGVYFDKIFPVPDSITLTKKYLLMKKNRKYCFVPRNDSLQTLNEISRTRKREDIEILIKQSQ